MSMSMSRRQFLRTLLVGAAGTIALEKLAELADKALALNGEFITCEGIRFVEATADGSELWYAIVHPDFDLGELRDLPPPDDEKQVHGEWVRLNSTMKFRRSEVLPPFERPVPRQVFRGAQWKHEQRPYHTRFA